MVSVGSLTMADELEELWKKLTVTEEEEEDIILGSNSTEVAKEAGKNCIVTKVVTQRSVNVEALKKNMRMLWKPNKGLQVSEIEDNLFLAEFGDSRDKKKVMEMRPWSYEKQLVLIREFEGKLVPKEISISWSPFWIQIYNLPLKSMTSGMGYAIGGKIGEVLEVDVPEKGVQWGKYLRVKVNLDKSRKLVRGKKVCIEGSSGRWVFFKYERLPNFCYRCGMLDHGEKVCSKSMPREENGEKGNAQYGPWLRGEPWRRANRENDWMEEGHGLNNKHRDEGAVREMRMPPRKNMMSKRQTGVDGETSVETSRPLGHGPRPCTEVTEAGGENPEVLHENGKVQTKEEKQAGMLDKIRIWNMDETRGHEDSNMGIREEIVTFEDKIEVNGSENFKPKEATDFGEQLIWAEDNSGPLAMSLDPSKGWISEELGPSSRHWNRLARKIKDTCPSEKLGPASVKREGPVPIQDLDPNTPCAKRGKGKGAGKKPLCEENEADGGEAVAARQHRQAQ